MHVGEQRDENVVVVDGGFAAGDATMAPLVGTAADERRCAAG